MNKFQPGGRIGWRTYVRKAPSLKRTEDGRIFEYDVWRCICGHESIISRYDIGRRHRLGCPDCRATAMRLWEEGELQWREAPPTKSAPAPESQDD